MDRGNLLFQKSIDLLQSLSAKIKPGEGCLKRCLNHEEHREHEEKVEEFLENFSLRLLRELRGKIFYLFLYEA